MLPFFFSYAIFEESVGDLGVYSENSIKLCIMRFLGIPVDSMSKTPIVVSSSALIYQKRFFQQNHTKTPHKEGFKKENITCTILISIVRL